MRRATVRRSIRTPRVRLLFGNRSSRRFNRNFLLLQMSQDVSGIRTLSYQGKHLETRLLQTPYLQFGSLRSRRCRHSAAALTKPAPLRLHSNHYLRNFVLNCVQYLCLGVHSFHVCPMTIADVYRKRTTTERNGLKKLK